VLRLFFSFFLILGRLLSRPVLLKIGRGLGKTAHRLFPEEVNKARKHLSLAFPEKKDEELDSLAKDVFIHLGMNFMELFWLPRLNSKNAGRIVEFIGFENLEKIRKENKPLFIITGHIGNWELMAAAVSLRGYSPTVIARKQDDSWIDRKIAKFRKRWNVETIWREEQKSSRQILSLLKNGGILATLMDQDTRIESVFVDFFGREAFTPSGPAALTLRTDCNVMAVYIHRNGYLKHKVTFKPVKMAKPTGNREKDIRSRTQLFTTAIENAIREHPAQWVWMHKRWKTQPLQNNNIGSAK